jgi:hypothetical protein
LYGVVFVLMTVGEMSFEVCNVFEFEVGSVGVCSFGNVLAEAADQVFGHGGVWMCCIPFRSCRSDGVDEL